NNASAKGKPTTTTTSPTTTTTTVPTTTTLPPPPLPELGKGLVNAGASKISIYPRPADYNGYWERDPDKCKKEGEGLITQLPDDAGDHLATAGSPWPENPDCIYMGGFGIGPANPLIDVDANGLYVRSAAINDGTDTLVLTIIDGEGYFWDYDKKCADQTPENQCGSKQIAESLGAELGIPSSNFVIAATHSHASPDFIGGWGFVPDWYMHQVRDSIKQSIREAVANERPATLEVGEENARPFNNERRDTYRSAEEQQVTWLRALSAGTATPETIMTIGAYAAHPTTKGTNGGVGSADWVGVFEKELEARFGGIGLHFMTGLGNMSTAGGTQMGQRLADIIPDIGSGLKLTNTDVRVAQTSWSQPATNVPLTALGKPGFFDRQFDEAPAEVRTGKSPDTAPCESASPVSVEVVASAAWIGDQFALTAAPGEVFSNLTNQLKDHSGALVTMPLGQANDALGYMPQSFEMSPVGQQGLGFVAGGVLVVNYEDAYSIDRCYGDMDLETTLNLLNSIR
ncbi:MAG: hypothetical protein QOH90_1003, partial [Actinomycetota bacterium]|nr:hypothetical protein [Actinomycetota bacterium]